MFLETMIHIKLDFLKKLKTVAYIKMNSRNDFKDKILCQITPSTQYVN